MTKVKVGMDDPSSVEFVEKRRAALERSTSTHVFFYTVLMKILSSAQIISVFIYRYIYLFRLGLAVFMSTRLHFLCRYLQRIVSHPLLLQDTDVREFLERDDVSFSVNISCSAFIIILFGKCSVIVIQ